MTLWCLHGKSKQILDENREIVYISSDELITSLNDMKDEADVEQIDYIIKKISLLKQGINI